MNAGRSSCAAHCADYITLIDLIADLDIYLVEMTVENLETVIVFDFDTPAESSCPLRKSDCAIACGLNWNAFSATETQELSRSGKPIHVMDRLQRMMTWFNDH